MKTTSILAVAALIVGGGLALDVARSQQPGVTRTELQRHDLGVTGREVIQVRVDLAPGVTFPPHSHPGEEIIYVIEGLWEYQVEGKPPSHPPQGRSTSSSRSSSSPFRTSPAPSASTSAWAGASMP